MGETGLLTEMSYNMQCNSDYQTVTGVTVLKPKNGVYLEVYEGAAFLKYLLHASAEGEQFAELLI